MTAPGPASPDRPSARRRRDPAGKAALFTAPVTAPPDHLAPGEPRQGKQALFSTGPRRPGTVVVTCSGCSARTRCSLLDVGLRLLTGSAWLPTRPYDHWMRCPACHAYRWCRIGWTD